MKKTLKFCSVILLAVLVFSFWFNFTKAGDKKACKACCVNSECMDLLKCDGYDTTKCDLVKQIGTGQCKYIDKTTFCSFSSKTEIEQLIDKVSGWMMIVALVVAPLMILLGGFYILTAAGDTKRSTKGKQIIIWASIGLAIFLFAKAFISILKSFLW